MRVALHGLVAHTASNCSATAPALLYLLHPCSRPALSAYRPSMAIADNCSAIAPALLYLLHP